MPNPGAKNIGSLFRDAQRRAAGGHVGPLVGTTPGRADKIETTVPDGSHVIPSDVVAYIGGSNSLSGLDILNRRFPHRSAGGMIGMPKIAGAPHIGIPHPHITGVKLPHLAGVPHMPGSHLATGGEAKTQVPCRLSDGEFVLGPEWVKEIGHGDAERGHRAIDRMILDLRKEAIKKQRSLPPPVGSHAKK